MSRAASWSSPLLLTLLLAAPGLVRADAPPKLKALLVTGGCCHDYPTQIKILTEELSKRLRVEWTVVHGADKRGTQLEIYKKKDWAKGYDVVVHNAQTNEIRGAAMMNSPSDSGSITQFCRTRAEP